MKIETIYKQEYDRKWYDFVSEQMELYSNNPSNANKYFSNLMARIDERVMEARRDGYIDGYNNYPKILEKLMKDVRLKKL